MRKNVVAIVGRPNVGKSTLFNRICQKRSAIVDETEGVTRDVKYENANWSGTNFLIVDTGGIIPKTNNDLNKAVRFQAEIAIEEADLVLFLVDTKVGTTAIDMEIAKILSENRQKIILVANKVDNEKDELEIYDFLQLGFGEPFPVGAINGRNMGDLLDQIINHLEPYPSEKKNDKIKVALVGKPNVGKSSLLNKLIGKNINIVNDEPGTTRDAIDFDHTYKNKTIRFIDTAGLRRKQRIKYGVEYFSTMRTIESINRANIVLILLDASAEISNQDQKIVSYATRNFKEIIILFNKWDLIEKDNLTTGEFVNKLKDQLQFAEFAPILFISALTGQRVHKIFDLILQVEEESKKRIPTSDLNKFLQKAIDHFHPTHSSGKHAMIYYCTQVKTQPPTFIFFCNDHKLITKHYQRYLQNQLRREYKFTGTTIKTFFRSRNR